MKLDYEGSTEQELETVAQNLHEYTSRFLRTGRLFELHENKVKPRLRVTRNSMLVEVGVGQGRHLGSYADLNYFGLEIDPEMLNRYAIPAAMHFGISLERLIKNQKGEIPTQNETIDKLFYVCSLHEADDLERELTEMKRAIKRDGRTVLVERMCAIEESPEHIRNLKDFPNIVPTWFSRNGFNVGEEDFKATYFGEYLTAPKGYPTFTFHLISAARAN